MALYSLSSADFLVLGITLASWVPHGSGLGLSGIDRHPPPSATRTLNQTNTGFLRPSFSRFEQEISHDMLHFLQPPALHPSPIYEEETLTGAVVPRAVTPPHTLGGPAHQILADRIHETAFFPSCWPQFAHNESPLEHQRTYCAKREEVTTTWEVIPLVCGGLHEACLLPHPSPSIRDKNVTAAFATDNPNGYNQDWSPWVCYYFFRRVSVSTYSFLKDRIAFNGFLRDETEVVCRWVENTTVCNDRVKGKDFTAHLQRRHRTTSDSRVYSCLWHECSASQPMMKSSLERHVRERHFPVKWACPSCTKTFTRKTTLLRHFKRCPGHI